MALPQYVSYLILARHDLNHYGLIVLADGTQPDVFVEPALEAGMGGIVLPQPDLVPDDGKQVRPDPLDELPSPLPRLCRNEQKRMLNQERFHLKTCTYCVFLFL